MEKQDFPKYEMMFVLYPDLGETKTNEAVEDVKKLITENGGDVFNEDVWGIRELAYTIKKQDEGYYMVINFTIDPSKIGEIEEPLNIEQRMLRYLITKTPKNYELVTLEKYENEAAEEAKEKKKEEDEKEAKKAAQRKPAKPVVKKMERKEKKEVKKVEEVKEDTNEDTKEDAKKAAAEKEKKEKASLAEVDEKLKSIIEDPDISL